MNPENDTTPSPEPNKPSAQHNTGIERQRFATSHMRIFFEIASVMVVLSIAIYFISGASSGSSSPQRGDASTANSTRPNPTNTTGSNLPTNLPQLQILSVTPDNSTAKISFTPFPGAKDYRIFDISEPTVVKYAGMTHLEGGPFLMNRDGTPVVPFQVDPNGNGPSVLNIPYPQIEWNLLEDGQPHTLVAQAVNMLGPIPQGNLYNDENAPLVASNQTVSTLGMNEGRTADGHVSINGQGPSTNHPQPIAQSKPFVVQANPHFHAIPSTSSATQTFFDTFADSEAGAFQKIASDPRSSSANYTLNAGTNKAWTIEYEGADVRDSYPFISAGHFMDVLFDGGTPGSGLPLHTQFAYMNMIPHQTADFSSGKVLHITMEVDLHQDARRWTGIELTPANDPLTNLDIYTGAINNSDKGFFFDYGPGACDATVLTGPGAGKGSDPNYIPVWGSDVSANHFCDLSQFYWGGAGINLDNRGRLDLFITQTHAALFINGQLAIESDIPGGLPFTSANVYFTHFVYHTSNDIGELKKYSPWESFWINYYHWSDERHWDNMGFEVFPKSAAPTSANWQRLVKGPGPISLIASATGSPGTGGSANLMAPGSALVADTPKGLPCNQRL